MDEVPFSHLPSSIRVPCRETLQKRLTSVHGRVMADVKAHLQGVELVAMMADAWEDAAHGEVLGVTVMPFSGVSCSFIQTCTCVSCLRCSSALPCGLRPRGREADRGERGGTLEQNS